MYSCLGKFDPVKSPIIVQYDGTTLLINKQLIRAKPSSVMNVHLYVLFFLYPRDIKCIGEFLGQRNKHPRCHGQVGQPVAMKLILLLMCFIF